jgi:hypothetical protein
MKRVCAKVSAIMETADDYYHQKINDEMAWKKNVKK